MKFVQSTANNGRKPHLFIIGLQDLFQLESRLTIAKGLCVVIHHPVDRDNLGGGRIVIVVPVADAAGATLWLGRPSIRT